MHTGTHFPPPSLPGPFLGVRDWGFSYAQGQTSLPRCLTSHSLRCCSHLGEPALLLRPHPYPPQRGRCAWQSMCKMGCGVRGENDPISKSVSRVCRELNSPHFSPWPQSAEVPDKSPEAELKKGKGWHTSAIPLRCPICFISRVTEEQILTDDCSGLNVKEIPILCPFLCVCPLQWDTQLLPLRIGISHSPLNLGWPVTGFGQLNEAEVMVCRFHACTSRGLSTSIHSLGSSTRPRTAWLRFQAEEGSPQLAASHPTSRPQKSRPAKIKRHL